MKKQSFPVTNIGSVSLLMVFIVLCLVTFATLSLSSAASDYRFSQNIAKHNNHYYKATNEATLRVKDIDQLLQSTYKSNPSNFMQVAGASLSAEPDLTVDFTLEEPSIAFQKQTDDARSIQVVLRLNKPENHSNGFYRITSWKEIHTSEWEANDNLKLVK